MICHPANDMLTDCSAWLSVRRPSVRPQVAYVPVWSHFGSARFLKEYFYSFEKPLISSGPQLAPLAIVLLSVTHIAVALYAARIVWVNCAGSVAELRCLECVCVIFLYCLCHDSVVVFVTHHRVVPTNRSQSGSIALVLRINEFRIDHFHRRRSFGSGVWVKAGETMPTMAAMVIKRILVSFL